MVQAEGSKNGNDVCNVRVQPGLLQLLDSITKQLEKLECEERIDQQPSEKGKTTCRRTEKERTGVFIDVGKG